MSLVQLIWILKGYEAEAYLELVRIDKLIFRFASSVVTQIHKHHDISVGGKSDRCAMALMCGESSHKKSLGSSDDDSIEPYSRPRCKTSISWLLRVSCYTLRFLLRSLNSISILIIFSSQPWQSPGSLPHGQQEPSTSSAQSTPPTVHAHATPTLVTITTTTSRTLSLDVRGLSRRQSI